MSISEVTEAYELTETRERTGEQTNGPEAVAPPRRDSVSGFQPPVVDPVFGAITEDGPNYRNLGWIGTAILMIKTQIGLGVLSIPAALNVLGIVPGMIILLFVGIITTWSGYIVGKFKLNHPNVYGLDDAVKVILGRFMGEVFSYAFVFFWIFVAGSGILGVSIGLNAVTGHAVCTAVFVAVAAVVGTSLASIKTLQRVAWLATLGVFFILAAIFTVTIAVGVQNDPIPIVANSSSLTRPLFTNGFTLFGTPTLTEALTAVSSIIFAFSGTPAFFSIISEMRDPTQFTKSLLVCQSVVTSVYAMIGGVVYFYCGSHVASPALGSAGGLIMKIAYGLSLPGLMVTTLLVIHIPAKYLHIRILRGTLDLTSNTRKHNIVWYSCIIVIAFIAYLIASTIPGFGGLVSLIGALLGTLMSLQPMGCMWLYDNWRVPKAEEEWIWKGTVVLAVFVIVGGTFMMCAGTYGSVVGIIEEYKRGGVTKPWSCADNSKGGGPG